LCANFLQTADNQESRNLQVKNNYIKHINVLKTEILESYSAFLENIQKSWICRIEKKVRTLQSQTNKRKTKIVFTNVIINKVTPHGK
jgi:hypothetical protein